MDKVGLYLVASLMFLKSKSSYSNIMTWNKLKDKIITLPVTVDSKLDYSYTAQYIKTMKKLQLKRE